MQETYVAPHGTKAPRQAEEKMDLPMSPDGGQPAPGTKLWKSIRFTVFYPGNKRYRRYKVTAPAKKAFHSAGIDMELAAAIDKVERWFPGHEYTFKQTGPNSFNFIWVTAKNPANSAAVGDAALEVKEGTVGDQAEV